MDMTLSAPADRSGDVWRLDEPFVGVLVSAELDGLCIRSQTRRSIEETLRHEAPASRLGRLMGSLLPVLEESGALVREDGGIRIECGSIGKLAELGVDAFDDLVPWAPFSLYIESRQSLGSAGFSYRYGYFAGRDRVSLERRGWFVRRGEQIFRLDAQSFQLVEAMDRWNATAVSERHAVQGLLEFARVKGLAEGVGADLDRHLSAANVVVPPRIGVDVIPESEGRISFAPRVSGVPATEFRRVFFAVDSPEASYSVEDADGHHYHVVFDENLREVIRRIWKVRHVGGREKREILSHPEAVFDGVLSHVDFDLSSFSARVIGIGPLELEPKRATARTGVLDGDAPGISLTVRTLGGVEKVVHGSFADIQTLAREIGEAKESGRGTIHFGGHEVSVEPALETQVAELLRERSRGRPDDLEPPGIAKDAVALQIHKDETGREYQEPERPRDHVPDGGSLPQTLSGAVTLKPHQVEGLGWLLANLRMGRRGCLLADDMGLGKTLQLLAFIAIVLQNDEEITRHGLESEQCERMIAAGRDPALPPWNPVLIVAPVILLENQTWQADMTRFFQGEGAVFLPWIDLRGPELKRLRRIGAAGRESDTGTPHLEIEQLKGYRLVLTNYETVVNYQFSLGQVPWSIIVTDEAQEFKTPSTRVSHAMKSLKAGFRVAATGTPVETSLEDVWNIFDFLEPSAVLGSLEEFRQKWVLPTNAEFSDGRIADLSGLRDTLGVGRADGRVLRREKTDHVSLPPKTEKILACDLSNEQLKRHEIVLDRARTGGPGNHPLTLINELMLVSQHPALLPQYNGVDANTLIAACPKLRTVLHSLGEIETLGEKALVFTRSIPMQQILRECLRERFGLDAGIVNGRSGRDGETSGSRNVRRQTLDQFRRGKGFDVLILSPEVAGLGLTIVEANHVIHYGRWWNPAKEIQATDRAYRIGQEKEVFVYYPVATDPTGRIRSFDQMLDDLLRRRKELSREFLRPGVDEEALGSELLNRLCAETGSERFEARIVTEGDTALLDGYRFEALVSAIERKRGRNVILTPITGDEGIDVVSLEGRTLRLLQCKHNASGIAVDREALDDLRRGLEGWSARRIPRDSHFTPRLGLVVSGPVTRALRREARNDGIDVCNGEDFRSLLRETAVTHAEMDAASARRADSMGAVRSQLAVMSQRVGSSG